MIRAASILALSAFPALADPVNLSHDIRQGDTATLHMESAVMGVLTYHNTGAQLSTTGEWNVSGGTLTCRIRVFVADAETATVTCPVGWIVDPASADVPDGDSFSFVVMLAGF